MARWKQRARAVAVAASLGMAVWLSSCALVVSSGQPASGPTMASWSAPGLGVVPDRVRVPDQSRMVEDPVDSVNPTEPPPWPARRVLRMAFAQVERRLVLGAD